jgi:serine/threonine-protein kinase
MPSADWTGDGMEQLGEYMVRRLVGEGGMGRVYEAEERLSKRRVALKVLREELSRSEQARALFLNEMQILAHLEHSNIVRSLACFEADGKLVTVLEFLEGRTLRDVLNDRGRLGWEESTHVVSCVAQALIAAHGQTPPVIHRDLKPENIMLLSDGSVKVMDFGIAKLIQALNQTNTQSVGTLQYMSPEQIDAQTVDQRSDLYCLGLVYYELLCGRPPFTSSSPRALLNLQCTETPPPLDEAVRSGLSKGIQRLVFQLLEKDPSARPSSAAEVVERLEPFMPDAGFVNVATRRPSSPAKTPGPTIPGMPATRVDTLPSEKDNMGASEAQSDAGPGITERAAKGAGRAPTPRKDTIALIDEASSGRELSMGLSLGIIAFLMIAAGTATYFWRASQAPEPSPAAEETPTTATS